MKGNNTKKLICAILSLVMAIALIPSAAFASDEEELPAAQVTFTFTDGGITASEEAESYTVSGTSLEITANGVFAVTGSAEEGTVTVAKGLTGVTLILDGLDLTSAVSAPIVVKKNSAVSLILRGENTLTDNEDASTEETNEDFEGAAIKVKSASSLTVSGDGVLNVWGNAKNGIKGGTAASITVNGGTINVKYAANNGIAADGSVTVNGGVIDITCENDGIKSVPDEGDTESAGTVTVTGGEITVIANGDGIQAGTDLTVTDGTFNITTFGGYNASGYDEDTMSCKGLKASGVDLADVEGATNFLTVSGGTFNLNTRDDAIHSDGDAIITGGTFCIYTGDDGVHADTSLTLGSEEGLERDPEIYVYRSYEGLESGTVYTYSGKYYIVASDDGINAAGGSSSGSNPWGGGNHFNPGGRPGWGGQSSSGDYNMYFYGGSFYVDCAGDGLDSNGNLYIYDGDFTVLSMQSGGDNSPIDTDGSAVISGGTVFLAGTNPMREQVTVSWQSYILQNTSQSANTVIYVEGDGDLVRSEKLVRNINYLLYTDPDHTSYTVTTGSPVDPCVSNAFAHNFDGGVITKEATEDESGIITYTCRDCGITEGKTIPAVSVQADDPDPDTGEGDQPGVSEFTATFVTGEYASVDVYYTQDYTEPSETGVTVAIARGSDTGLADVSGDGQINFTVTAAEGHEITGVSVEGEYKNLKDVSEEAGLANTYRITKIAGDLTVTVTTADVQTGESDQPGVSEFTATFVTGEYASVDVYYTQDYTEPSETGVTAAIARGSDTGLADVSGDGQINFTVAAAEGHEITGISVEGEYKNLKDVSEEAGIANTYRITKIAGDLTVTVTTKVSEVQTVLPGDVNGDGKINVRDVAMMMRAQAGWTQDGYVRENEDFNCDGTFNLRDIAALMRAIASGTV